MVNILTKTISALNTSSRSIDIILHIPFVQPLAHKITLLNFNIQKPSPYEENYSQQQLTLKG